MNGCGKSAMEFKIEWENIQKTLKRNTYSRMRGKQFKMNGEKANI